MRRWARRVMIGLAVLGAAAAAGAVVVTTPAAREAAADTVNTEANAYLRFVFSLYQGLAGKG